PSSYTLSLHDALPIYVGPDANGLIPVVMEERLLAMGEWLRVNGEAIYGSTAWNDRPPTENNGVYYTRKGNDLYVLCTQWPEKELDRKSTRLNSSHVKI